MRYIWEIFGAPRFSSFSTQSPRKADLLYAVTVAALTQAWRSGASPSDDPDWPYKMQFSCTGRNPL
jgi:hypothetical protein